MGARDERGEAADGDCGRWTVDGGREEVNNRQGFVEKVTPPVCTAAVRAGE